VADAAPRLADERLASSGAHERERQGEEAGHHVEWRSMKLVAKSVNMNAI
jgi:hypothetical protein